jgi:hypothetical protein
VSGSEVFPLGIPLTVTMTPIEAGGGWRFASKTGSRFTPYAGAAFLSMGYTETSDFAGAGDNTSERFTGQDLFGGVDIGIVKWLAASAEVQTAACRSHRRRGVEGVRGIRSRRLHRARHVRHPHETIG